MLPKSYVVFKWVVYAIATLFLCALQSLLLNHIRVLGLTPFLYPVLPAAVAMFEGSRRGAVFALLFGIACDLLLPAPFRGFFTLIFPVAAFVAGGVAERLASRGFLCALIVSSLGRLFPDVCSDTVRRTISGPDGPDHLGGSGAHPSRAFDCTAGLPDDLPPVCGRLLIEPPSRGAERNPPQWKTKSIFSGVPIF